MGLHVVWLTLVGKDKAKQCDVAVCLSNLSNSGAVRTSEAGIYKANRMRGREKRSLSNEELTKISDVKSTPERPLSPGSQRLIKKRAVLR